MRDGFYFIRHGSYEEHGPYPAWATAFDEGVEATFYSRDFIIQQWAGGNMIREWRDFSALID